MPNPNIAVLSVRKRAIMTACLVVCVVFMLEGVLQLAALASPRVRTLLAPPWRSLRNAQASPTPEPLIADALLGHRPNTNYPGHDARGFRNPAALPTAGIVALGDSHTYGANVAPEQTWTRLLADSLGEPVYNMAFGGWGPAHELALLPEALELRPKLILVGVYAGNDLYDCFDLVYQRKTLTELATTDPAERTRIAAAEAAEPAKQRIEGIWRDLYSDILGANAESGLDATVAPAAVTDEPAVVEPSLGPRRLISEYSKLYGLARAAKDALADHSAEQRRIADIRWGKSRRRAAERPEQCVVFESGAARTILTPRVRLVALDQDDPRIAEGFRIAVRSLCEIQERAAAVQAQVAVVFLPTKEYVFRDLVHESGRPASPDYEHLVAAEARLWSELRDRLAARNIEIIDTVPALRAALRAGEVSYPADRDGHPTPAGHRVIARTVEDGVRAERKTADSLHTNALP